MIFNSTSFLRLCIVRINSSNTMSPTLPQENSFISGKKMSELHDMLDPIKETYEQDGK